MNWIDRFLDYHSDVSSPELFKLWGAISLVSAAMERKTWMTNSLGTLYPNLYVFLVSPPGVGKTVVTSKAWHLISALDQHKVASPSVTRATIVQELDKAKRFFQHAKGTIQFNCLYICVDEFGVMFPEWDSGLMNKLTHMFDGHQYGEERRNEKHSVSIPRPLYNMLVGGTPGYMASLIPEVAWDQGFMSRCLMVYSSEVIRQSLFRPTKAADPVETKALIAGLRAIGNLYGEFKFTSRAAELMDAFYLSGHEETKPLHPRLQHYGTRRPAHLLKLCMVASAADNAELVIDEKHFLTAFQWLTDAETTMPQIFKAMQSGGDLQIIEEAWYHLYEQMTKRRTDGIPEAELFAFLTARVPSEKIKWIIQVMESSNLLGTTFKDGKKLIFPRGSPKK